MFLLAGLYYLLSVAGVLNCWLTWIIVLQQVGFIWFSLVCTLIRMYIVFMAENNDFFWFDDYSRITFRVSGFINCFPKSHKSIFTYLLKKNCIQFAL